MKGFIILSIEEKIDQAKDIAKDGFDKVTGNKNLVLISIFSSVVAAPVVVAVLIFFFSKIEKSFLGNYIFLKQLIKYLSIQK